MDTLSSELLLSIFKRLTSIEMVNVIPVCRSWLEVIDNNKALWRSLVLPERERGWPNSALEMFDRKSQSTLTEISMDMQYEDCLQREGLFACSRLMMNSKDTLQTVNIFRSDVSPAPSGAGAAKLLLSLFYRNLDNVEDFRVLDRKEKVQLIKGREVRGQVATDAKLKILWIEIHKVRSLPASHLITNLVSLSVVSRASSSEWRGILEAPSKNLKHLSIQIDDEDPGLQISSVVFPKLEVLEFNSFSEIPRWMDAPKLSVLITGSCYSCLISSSSVSKLWFDGNPNYYIRFLSNLGSSYPSLSELILQPSQPFPNHSAVESLSQTLIQRSREVAARTKVDGIEMKQVQKLVLSHLFSNSEIDPMLKEITNLRKLVGEIVAFGSESRIIEVEI